MVYITNDVEAAGPNLGVCSTLSIGACIMVREEIPFTKYWEKGLVFYAELKPDSLFWKLESMRVGCSRLICLEGIRKKVKCYDSESFYFSPSMVLEFMENHCESQASAMQRFTAWIEGFSRGQEITGVTDTVFFDAGRIDLCFGLHCFGGSPYGYKGLDLSSIYKGYTKRPQASLKELKVKDERDKPHRADQDAVYMAQIGRELLFKRMKW